MTAPAVTDWEPQRRVALRLVKDLLVLETLLKRGRSPYSIVETGSRLLLIDRLLNASSADLATLGLPMPLPSPAAIIDAKIRTLSG